MVKDEGGDEASQVYIHNPRGIWDDDGKSFGYILREGSSKAWDQGKRLIDAEGTGLAV